MCIELPQNGAYVMVDRPGGKDQALRDLGVTEPIGEELEHFELASGQVRRVRFRLLAYSLQIFFDFAGYSAIAIGSARLFGYVFPENFNTPYIGANISDFWRRWHMTLSRWIRDYIYIPLGGSRGSKLSGQANLLVTMGLAGLWHGASWNFAIWGIFHGFGDALKSRARKAGARGAGVHFSKNS